MLLIMVGPKRVGSWWRNTRRTLTVRMTLGAWTPLYWACANNHTDVVHYLVGNGYSDPSIQDNLGLTPFDKSNGVTRKYLREIIS